MKLEINQTETIRQYLLGLVPDEDLPAIDERLVTDGEFYDELLIVESELIDQYLSNELSTVEREKFETHFLVTPERVAQVRFSKSFHRYLDEKAPAIDSESVVDDGSERNPDVDPPPPKPWYYSFLPVQRPALAYGAMVAVLVLVAGVSWRVMKNRSVEQVGPIFAVTLAAGTTRGADDGVKRISIPPGTGTVELRLLLGRENYGTYVAVCLNENAEIWRVENIQVRNEANARYLVVGIPARLLSPGDYSLKVSGKDADGKNEDLPTYRFQIQR